MGKHGTCVCTIILIKVETLTYRKRVSPFLCHSSLYMYYAAVLLMGHQVEVPCRRRLQFVPMCDDLRNGGTQLLWNTDRKYMSDLWNNAITDDLQ